MKGAVQGKVLNVAEVADEGFFEVFGLGQQVMVGFCVL